MPLIYLRIFQQALQLSTTPFPYAEVKEFTGLDPSSCLAPAAIPVLVSDLSIASPSLREAIPKGAFLLVGALTTKEVYFANPTFQNVVEATECRSCLLN